MNLESYAMSCSVDEELAIPGSLNHPPCDPIQLLCFHSFDSLLAGFLLSRLHNGVDLLSFSITMTNRDSPRNIRIVTTIGASEIKNEQITILQLALA